jgi:hypothetical protein
MSSRNFRNLNRAFNRGHITVYVDQGGRVSMHRKVKSDKVGAGNHSRWVKNMNQQYADGQLKASQVPQKWATV